MSKRSKSKYIPKSSSKSSKSKSRRSSKGKQSSGQLSPLEQKVFQYVNAQPKGKMPRKKLQKKLAAYFPPNDVRKAIDALMKKKQLFEHSNGMLAYFPPKDFTTRQFSEGNSRPLKSGKFDSDIVTGVIDFNSQGNGYVRVDGDENLPDVFISHRQLNRAFSGDQVEVMIQRFNRNGKPEGAVTQVLKRNSTLNIGKLVRQNGSWYLISENRNVTHDFRILEEEGNDFQAGDRVITEWVEWPDHERFPLAKVIDKLSGISENDEEMMSILVQNGFKTQFSDAVMAEAKRITLDIPSAERELREDFSDVLTFTIDPDDAKDFDDALSYQVLENGNIEIGVHIADVAHYVKPKSELDREAFNRATSVYLVDRVNPMLPEHLSNFICSLRPQEEKCTFSAIFEFSSHKKLVHTRFRKTIIHSDKRLTYNQAKALIDTGNTDDPITEALIFLNKAAQHMKNNRMRSGAIAFESQELKFKFDDEGNLAGIEPYERHDAHFLIEEFMLLANKKVAECFSEQIGKQELTAGVYRIHDSPDEEKLSNLELFATYYGYHLDFQTPNRTASSINNMLKEAQGKPEQQLLETLTLRSMAKAKYTTQNVGHYGLAFRDYTHFTSPIRRYPDILVHRVLHDVLTGRKTMDPKFIEPACLHCSERERKAMEAERESQKVKQVEFLQGKEGMQFSAVISGLTNFGMFVSLVGLGCEGLVPLETMDMDVYVYEEKKMKVYGKYHGHEFRIGQAVEVMLVDADMPSRKINFKLIEEQL